MTKEIPQIAMPETQAKIKQYESYGKVIRPTRMKKLAQ
jgi:hypothetical protein